MAKLKLEANVARIDFVKKSNNDCSEHKIMVKQNNNLWQK